MSYTTGLGAVKANLEAMEAAGRGQWLNELYWNGKQKPEENRRFVRFLTDDVISIGVHEYIPTANGKKQDFICARQLASPRPCIICDTFQIPDDDGNLQPARPRTLTFGLVCLREEKQTVVDGRRRATYEDVMVEIEDQDKKKVMVRDYRIIRQSQKTFWSNIHGYFARFGTIIDRDYEISRTGSSGSNTVYTILPCEETPGLITAEDIDKHYSDVPETLVQYIERNGSAKRYEKFLGVAGGQSEAPSGATTESSQTVEKGEPAGETQNQTAFGGLKDKLMEYSGNKSS